VVRIFLSLIVIGCCCKVDCCQWFRNIVTQKSPSFKSCCTKLLSNRKQTHLGFSLPLIRYRLSHRTTRWQLNIGIVTSHDKMAAQYRHCHIARQDGSSISAFPSNVPTTDHQSAIRDSNPGRGTRFISSERSRPVLGPTQPPIQYVPGFFSGLKRSEMRLTTHLNLLPRFKMNGAVPTRPSICLNGVYNYSLTPLNFLK
jgi:hypothetical protein